MLHLSDAAVLGLDPFGHDHTGRPLLIETILAWCDRPGTTVRVHPVIDPDALAAAHHERAAYEPTTEQLRTVRVLHPTCVFPWCTRPSKRCDADHIHPHADGGPTCECNLAPRCRHHHRLKTHAGWTYTHLGHDTYLWAEPHGQHLLRDGPHTTDVTSDPPARNRAAGYLPQQ